MTKIRFAQTLFAGAATVAALAMFNPSSPGTPLASGSAHLAASSAVGGNIIAVDDTNPDPGDVFTQNAQDQSTANGAGT
jgi:hypothetical protein